jgi:hypothetical protein
MLPAWYTDLLVLLKAHEISLCCVFSRMCVNHFTCFFKYVQQGKPLLWYLILLLIRYKNQTVQITDPAGLDGKRDSVQINC